MKEIRRPTPITLDTFIISDLHFSHKNVTEFEPSRVTAMMIDGCDTQEDMLISRINNTVGEDDTLLILGDYAFKGIKEWTEKINCKNLQLVRGNHDKKSSHAYYDAGFEYVYDTVEVCTSGGTWKLDQDDTYISGVTMTIGDEVIAFTHYPLDFYEDYYTKQRSVDLTMRVAKLSKIFDKSGIIIECVCP